MDNFVAVVVSGPAWLLFGGEPRQADDGALNPLVLVAPAVLLVFGVALVPQVIALVRRPIVAADHHAITVRPGVGRTLMLPWVQVAELAAVDLDEEEVLLVRCRPVVNASGVIGRDGGTRARFDPWYAGRRSLPPTTSPCRWRTSTAPPRASSPILVTTHPSMSS